MLRMRAGGWVGGMEWGPAPFLPLALLYAPPCLLAARQPPARGGGRDTTHFHLLLLSSMHTIVLTDYYLGGGGGVHSSILGLRGFPPLFLSALPPTGSALERARVNHCWYSLAIPSYARTTRTSTSTIPYTAQQGRLIYIYGTATTYTQRCWSVPQDCRIFPLSTKKQPSLGGGCGACDTSTCARCCAPFVSPEHRRSSCPPPLNPLPSLSLSLPEKKKGAIIGTLL